MATSKVIYSKKYTQYKLDQYYKLITSKLVNLESKQFRQSVLELVVDRFIKFIQQSDDLAIKRLKILPKSYTIHAFNKYSNQINYILLNKYKQILTQVWNEAYTLGIHHQILDMLYVTKLFPSLDKAPVKFFSLINGSNLTETVAEFADGDVPQNPNIVIGQAKRNLTILQDNIKLLKAQGIYPGDLMSSDSKAARLTVEQRIQFLRAIQEIADFNRKAQVSKKSFLGDNYVERRISILAADYTSKYDTSIKEAIADYVNSNIEGVAQIKNTPARTIKLKEEILRHIGNALETGNLEEKKIDYAAKSRSIVRTELSIAYNFGKLSGFTSQVDRTRIVRWHADWELEKVYHAKSKKYYEVCNYCQQMDGKISTVAELMLIGTQLDKGVLRYGGSGQKTSFKDESLPQIPAHVNCNCFWTIEPLQTEETVAKTAAQEPTISTEPIGASTAIGYEYSPEGIMQETKRVSDSNFPSLLGAGLLVGGLFLAARSNVWRAFIRNAIKITEEVAPTVSGGVRRATPIQIESPTKIVSDVEDVVKIIKKEIASPVLTDEFGKALAGTIGNI